MQSGRSQRAPGSFSPLPGSISSAAAAAAAASGNGGGFREKPLPPRPQIRRIDTSDSDDMTASQLHIPKTRSPQTPNTPVSPAFAALTAHPNHSSASLQSQNVSRSAREAPGVRTASPLTLPPVRSAGGTHSRKHSQTQGLFEPTLPSTSTSNLSHIGMAQPGHSSLSASQIAAQAAMQHQQHNRQRSQTVPFPGGEGQSLEPAKRNGHLSPPTLSLTEASVPREGGFGGSNPAYHNGLLGSHTQAATTAANVVFPRTSPASSPGLPTPEPAAPSMPPPPPPLMPEKPAKAEKSKVKLFSRPKKIDTKNDSKEKPLPSPGKIGSALASLQRGNFSTASLVEIPTFYNQANASTATIRPVDVEKEGKEKKHHFLSRQKHKLSNRDDYHLPLSSAASNSKPVDPNAPSSLYNFNIPPSPGPSSASFSKSVSGLDLRHGGRALREKRKEEKMAVAHDNESVYTVNTEWPGPGSYGTSLSATQSNLALLDTVDSAKYGLNNMTIDDAWPWLKAKLLVIFEGEDLRLPVEDFNRVVSMHIQYCIQRRAAHIIIDDLRELLSTGFASLDHTLGKTSDDRLIPAVVELWVFTFTSILPCMQAVFLPLDLEVAGAGPLLSPEKAKDFWASVMPSTPASTTDLSLPPTTSTPLDVRRLVLLAYRDAIILPRYERLKTIFSRLSLEHLPSSLASLALASPPSIGDGVMSSSPRDIDARPGTAMSIDPSLASYNSQSTTLLGENNSNPSRSRAISNVSFGSGSVGSEPLLSRPLSSTERREREAQQAGGSSGREREQSVEYGSKQITDMVGRMLQCMSVLASVGSSGLDTSMFSSGSVNAAGPSNAATGGAVDDGSKMVDELGRLLKLNWLGRGRTGRNRRGIVGGRVKRDESGTGGAAASGLGIRMGGSGILREGVGAAG